MDSSSEPNAPDARDAFETWLLRRVAEAVEGNGVSANLLTELQAALAEVRARPPEARDGLALMDLAERFDLLVDQLKELLANLEAQPTLTREPLLRQVVEAWLKEQREEYRVQEHGG